MLYKDAPIITKVEEAVEMAESKQSFRYYFYADTDRYNNLLSTFQQIAEATGAEQSCNLLPEEKNVYKLSAIQGFDGDKSVIAIMYQ